MNKTNKFIHIMLIAFSLLTLGACAPEIGSEAWCEQLKEKSKGEWTANELADYTKHCIF